MQNILDVLLFSALFLSVLVGFGAVCDSMSDMETEKLLKVLGMR